MGALTKGRDQEIPTMNNSLRSGVFFGMARAEARATSRE